MTTGRTERRELQYKIFRGTFTSWDALCQAACDFATSIGPERVASVSHSHSATGGDGVIFVWYWD